MKTLAEQRAAVVREIGMRRSVYPKWVEKGRMTPVKAATEIAAMESVLATLDAVPTMLDALRDAEREINIAAQTQPQASIALATVRAAIAKAEGRE